MDEKFPYNRRLKLNSRKLRNEQTEAEQKVWFRIRRKQLHGVQFYRQKPLGNFIVDFYAPRIKLVIEIDGSQHYTETGQTEDYKRDQFLTERGLAVLRFSNREAMTELENMIMIIDDYITEVLGNAVS